VLLQVNLLKFEYVHVLHFVEDLQPRCLLLFARAERFCFQSELISCFAVFDVLQARKLSHKTTMAFHGRDKEKVLTFYMYMYVAICLMCVFLLISTNNKNLGK
jgi:hypothetical protein